MRAALESFAQRIAGSGERDAVDAARYRWLRAQHWNDADICVVAHPKGSVKLGTDCPSLERLDAAIDAALTQPEATR